MDNINDFVQIHCHTEFSLLDGMTRIPDLVKKVKSMGQTAVCVSDHGNMHGIVDLHNTCKDNNIKPLYSFEAYVVDKAEEKTKQKRNHLLLIAKNQKGYENISQICSYGQNEGFYYKPRIDYNIIEKIGTEGIIASSACIAGIIPSLILQGDMKKVEESILYHKQLFEDFYFEIQPTIHPEQIIINKALLELSQKYDVPLIATNDAHYLDRKHSKTHDLLLCMQTSKLYSDPNRWKFAGDTYFVASRNEMEQMFNENGHEVLDQNMVKEALDNTVTLADKCTFDLNVGGAHMPQVFIPENDINFNKWNEKKGTQIPDSKDYLRYLCIKGLKEKNKTSKEYRDRLDYELNIINTMGYTDYFLIYEDIIKFCKEEDIPVGPGRGSGAGSLTNYALDITTIDPLEYGLLFERFLNPERKGHLPKQYWASKVNSTKRCA